MRLWGIVLLAFAFLALLGLVAVLSRKTPAPAAETRDEGPRSAPRAGAQAASCAALD